MREVVSLYVGQAGIQMGRSCWELFCQEHGITTTGEILNDTDKGISTFFKASADGPIVPRALLIDTEPSVVEDIKMTQYGSLFPSEQIVTGNEDAANNWSKGLAEMSVLGDTIMERLRRVCAECSSLQGIFLFHSSGGGTGSGLGSALLERLRDDMAKLPIFSFCAWPSPRLSTTVVEPYNTILSLTAQLDASTISVILDNEALYNICRNALALESPTYSNLNRLISQTVSSWTASLRFPGTLNLDMNEMATNLVPFPDLHFMLTSYAPILGSKKPTTVKTPAPQFTAEYITSAAFESEALFAKCDLTHGAYVACTLMYRGDFNPKEVSSAIGTLKDRKNVKFVDWCPTGFKFGMNSRPPSVIPNGKIGAMDRSVCAMMNTTAVQDIFERIADRFDAMYTQRAHLHWYACEGTGAEEFEAGRQRLKDLIIQYKQSEGGRFESEDSDDELAFDD